MLQDINQGVENIRGDSVLKPTRRPRHVAEGMGSASREELAAANSAETQKSRISFARCFLGSFAWWDGCQCNAGVNEGVEGGGAVEEKHQ